MSAKPIINYSSKPKEVACTEQFNPLTGLWEKAIPEPYYYGLIPFMWKRITFWRDEYGRKAQFVGWSEFNLF